MFEVVLKIALKFSCFAFLLWLYKELTTGLCSCKRDLSGTTVVMTGAGKGVGFQVAADLAKRGAKIIIGCRKNGSKVTSELKSIVPDAKVVSAELDLSSEDSIVGFVKEVMDETETIDNLILNATTVGR